VRELVIAARWDCLFGSAIVLVLVCHVRVSACAVSVASNGCSAKPSMISSRIRASQRIKECLCPASHAVHPRSIDFSFLERNVLVETFGSRHHR
jgi:hypothetical protein